MSSINLGQRVAPARFLLFTIVFVAGLAIAIPPLGWSHGAMMAFDAGAATFLAAIVPLLRRGEAGQMRRASRENDANRVGLLVVTGVTMIVILTSVAKEMAAKNDILQIALVIATLVLAWLFSNMVYALHYAHLFYLDDDNDGEDMRGIEFPKTPQPDYWDFIYFAFTLGMTFQTSDVEITSRRIRRIVTGHCLAAFVFNLGVLAFTINVLGG